MASKFNGFTQEEINRLGVKPKKPQMLSRGIRRVPDKKVVIAEATSQDKPDKRLELPKAAPEKRLPPVEETLESSIESTIASMQEVLHFKPLSAKQAVRPDRGAHEQIPVDESILHLSNCIESGGKMVKISEPAVSSTNGNATEGVSPFRGLSLQDFQAQQKMIKEQNKQKKELLQKAIEHHSQKTVAEIHKIEEIKGELGKLDSDLAADVAILRKKIEDATIAFAQIQKAYERVEAQFLKAKMSLHQAGEKKELLTEHLCAVIAHNEDRKAKKLTELMEKLGLSPVDDHDLSPDSDDSDG